MVIIINKETTAREIEDFLNQTKKTHKKSLSSYYGKLKGAFGDGLAYQKKLRGEWN